jgi:hypothetical protein
MSGIASPSKLPLSDTLVIDAVAEALLQEI